MLSEANSPGKSPKNAPPVDSATSTDLEKQAKANAVTEQNLQQMEAMLKHSANGVHILFENAVLARVMKGKMDDKDFFDFDKMKTVQDVMTVLISKKSFFDKLDYVQSLDEESLSLLVRTYLHLVENTVRTSHEFPH